MRRRLPHALLIVLLASAIFVGTFIPPAYASTDSDNARNQAKQILSQKRYGSQDKRPLSKNVTRLSQWLGAKKGGQIKRKTDPPLKYHEPRSGPEFTPPALGGLSGFAIALLYIIAGLIVASVGYFIYKAIRSRERDKKDEEVVDDELAIDWTDEEKVLDSITDADHLERLSEQAEQAGRYDVALRYRFRAGLLRLNDMSIIAFHPSVTNAQWQLTMNNAGFNSLTRDFNDVTYGQRECDATIVARARSGWSTLIHETKPQPRNNREGEE